MAPIEMEMETSILVREGTSRLFKINYDMFQGHHKMGLGVVNTVII